MIQESYLSIFAAKEAERFKLKVGVFLFLIQDGRILLLRRYRTGVDDGCYVVPMGGHDGNEPLTQTLIREAKEEINIDLEPENLSVCHVMHRFYPMPNNLSFEQIDFYFRIKKYKGTIQNNETDRCDNLAFFPLDALPQATEPFVLAALAHIAKGEFYSEWGFNNPNGDIQ